MPTTSIISAVITKYNALTASGFPSSTRPPIYLDEAPATDSSGTQERPGYVVLRDRGLVPQYLGFERHTAEVNEFEMEVFYESLADVDTAVAAIKLNGGTRAQANGFDLGTLSDLTTPRSTLQILRTRETRRFVGVSLSGARVHSCTLEYRVMVQEDP
jgi:hypothetical protein